MKGKEGLRIDLLYMDVLVSSLGFPHFHFIIRHEGGVLSRVQIQEFLSLIIAKIINNIQHFGCDSMENWNNISVISTTFSKKRQLFELRFVYNWINRCRCDFFLSRFDRVLLVFRLSRKNSISRFLPMVPRDNSRIVSRFSLVLITLIKASVLAFYSDSLGRNLLLPRFHFRSSEI